MSFFSDEVPFSRDRTPEISRKEDDEYVYYEIPLGDDPQDKVDVKIENGQVDISGRLEENREDDGTSTRYSSSFRRSFPAPDGVDPSGAKVERQAGRLVLKFPKIRT